MCENVTVAILAGGQSSRMGSDKGFVELRGKPLVSHVIERVSRLSLPIIIISNQPARYGVLGLPVFGDVLPNRSSLSGLYSAIFHSSSDYTLCVACDMPFLHPALLAYIISLCEGYDAVVPVVDGHPQGLHALYRKSCLQAIFRQIEKKQLKIRELHTQVKTRWVAEADLRGHERRLDSFVSINTPEDVRAAESTGWPDIG